MGPGLAIAVMKDRDVALTRRVVARPVAAPPEARLHAVAPETSDEAATSELAEDADGAVTDSQLSEDAEFSGALLGVLRDQRWENARALGARLRAAGLDSTVCDFVEDDLREATEALADVESFFQESLEALARPTPSVLGERAADASVLDRVDDLYVVLSNLRRRLVQVAAGVRRGVRYQLPPP